jgi:hypothetical protein
MARSGYRGSHFTTTCGNIGAVEQRTIEKFNSQVELWRVP